MSSANNKGRTSTKLFAALALSSMAACTPALPHKAPETADEVQIQNGILKGSLSEKNYVSFLGVPFAAPPVGDLRWAPPAPVKDWDGVYNATEFKADCMQVIPKPGSWNYREGAKYSEDCLYLNVFAPTDAIHSDKKLPVMFWVFGGGFLAGGISDPAYRQPSAYTDRDVIIVAANYRLGSFGYLAHPDFSAKSLSGTSGNYGSMDHIAALEWVRDNIEAFGGDPENVTVFGESSGGIASNVLFSTPSAEPLWSKSIIQSGPAWGLTPYMKTLDEAESWGKDFLAKRGATTLEEARALPADAINGLDADENAVNAFAFQPIADGVLTHETSGDTFLLGKQPAKPMIIGWTREEAAYFYGFEQTEETMRGWFEREFGDRAEDLISAYYKNDGDFRGAMVRAGTAGIAQGSLIQAKLHSQKTDQVYVYRFDQTLPGARNEALGVPHGTDVGFTFGHFPSPTAWRESDYALSETLIDYWTSFARTGTPSSESGPNWPTFDVVIPQVMYFKTPVEVAPIADVEVLKRTIKTANFSRNQDLKTRQNSED